MQTPGPVFDIYLNNIISAAKSECAVATESARAYDRYPSVGAMTEAGIKELRLVLVAMKPETKSAIDEILDDIRIHIIKICWRTFCIVMPNSDTERILNQRNLTQTLAGLSNTIRVNCALPVENVVVMATRESNHREVHIRKVEDINLPRWVNRMRAVPLIKFGVEIAKCGKPLVV